METTIDFERPLDYDEVRKWGQYLHIHFKGKAIVRLKKESIEEIGERNKERKNLSEVPIFNLSPSDLLGSLERVNPYQIAVFNMTTNKKRNQYSKLEFETTMSGPPDETVIEEARELTRKYFKDYPTQD